MPFSASEKERVRYHLGYMNVQPAASLQFGLPKPTETIFLVETAMTNMLAEGEERIRRYLNILDGVEETLVCAQERIALNRTGSTELNRNEPEDLEGEYYRWACRLADALGVPLNPYAVRFQNQGGVVAGSIPVRS